MVLRGRVLLFPLSPSRYSFISRLDGGVDGMAVRGRVLLCLLLPIDTAAFSRLGVQRRVWSYGVWYSCAPSLPLGVAGFSRADRGGEGMVLRGRVLLCPSLLLDTALFRVLTVEWRVWSYGVGYCCAPSLPLDAAVFSRFDWSRGYGPTGSGTVVPPLLHFLVLTGEGRV